MVCVKIENHYGELTEKRRKLLEVPCILQLMRESNVTKAPNG